MNIFGMTTNEYIENLRKKGQMKCPECEDGFVRPIGKAETSHYFKCDKCRFKIEEYYRSTV